MEDKLKQCTIVLTRACNLRCDFCYVKDAGYDPQDMLSYGDLIKIVDFCGEAGMKYIFFSGGEPLTYPHILDVLQYIKNTKPTIVTAIATNGVLLENSDFCKKLVDSGVGYVDISMKGTDPIGWKNTTGYDGYSKQLSGIRNLAATSLEFTCSMVVTRDSVSTFCDAVQAAIDNGAKQFSFTFIIDNNDSIAKDEKYLEKNDPIALIDCFLLQTDRLNSLTDDWWIEYSFPLCMYTKKQLEALTGRLASPCQIHKKNAVTFNTKMQLLPCDMYITHPLGTLGVDFTSFEEYKKLAEQPAYHETMDSIRQMPSAECGNCEHLDSCYGGCPVLWKNYSFEALTEFKKKYSTSK